VVSAAPGAAATSRRTVLSFAGTGLAAGAAALLAGCGAQGPVRPKIPPAAAGADIELLGRLLDLEYQAIAAYTAGIPLLSGPAQDAAKQFLGQELTHAGELSGLIKEAGGKANKPRASYQLGRPRTPTEILQLLHTLERAEVAGYLHAIPSINPGPVRAAAAALLANDAQHVAVLRSMLGLEPLAGAFVAGGE
jgi:hypothetical protein